MAGSFCLIISETARNENDAALSFVRADIPLFCDTVNAFALNFHLLLSLPALHRGRHAKIFGWVKPASHGPRFVIFDTKQ